MEKIYKYHTRLLALYGNLDSNYVKTRNALKDIDVDSVALEDARNRGYITKIPYEKIDIKIKNPNGSDKSSNWWKMTPKGYLVLVEKFNIELTEEQQLITARYLLNGG